MAKLYTLGSIMDDCLDAWHGSDDGWSALSYMNPILGSMGELGSLGRTPIELGWLNFILWGALWMTAWIIGMTVTMVGWHFHT